MQQHKTEIDLVYFALRKWPYQGPAKPKGFERQILIAAEEPGVDRSGVSRGLQGWVIVRR